VVGTLRLLRGHAFLGMFCHFTSDEYSLIVAAVASFGAASKFELRLGGG
jgi:hypothetical protein